MTLVSAYFISLARPILFSSVRTFIEAIHTPATTRILPPSSLHPPALSRLIRQAALRESSNSMEEIEYDLGLLASCHPMTTSRVFCMIGPSVSKYLSTLLMMVYGLGAQHTHLSERKCHSSAPRSHCPKVQA